MWLSCDFQPVYPRVYGVPAVFAFSQDICEAYPRVYGADSERVSEEDLAPGKPPSLRGNDR